MATLKFADTHNMVAFLPKPIESDGFEQIVDVLNAHPIRYGLTINPTIYISCIEQFWSTVMAKNINGEEQLHALVDGKKIIITESSVRTDLQLVDEEGVDCLPNSTIFEQLTLMGPKTTAWNEFSSTMASAIICLATNQKFNFSKFIFESMIRNLDNLSGKFLMYPRKPKRKDTQVPYPSDPIENVADEAVYKELGDSSVRAATTASSLEAEQDSGNINKTQSKATPNESSSQGTNSGGEITLVSVHDVNVFAGEEVFATTVDDIILAQVLEEMKSTKHKKKRIVIQELGLIKKLLEFNEETRLAREKAEKEEEVNIALIETWDDIQEKIDVDHQLAKKMQAQEQEELSIKEKATLFQQLLEKRRNHFAAKRAEEKRSNRER
ncbi:hypothetical protein Tco_1501041 [Tanacetum coccineum]